MGLKNQSRVQDLFVFLQRFLVVFVGHLAGSPRRIELEGLLGGLVCLVSGCEVALTIFRSNAKENLPVRLLPSHLSIVLILPPFLRGRSATECRMRNYELTVRRTNS